MRTYNSRIHKVKAVAVALLDKQRVLALKLYLDGYPPSTISSILKQPKILVRSRLHRDFKSVDIKMIKDNITYQKLTELDCVYDYNTRRCKLCNKKKNYTAMVNHLIKYHKDYIEKILNEIGIS